MPPLFSVLDTIAALSPANLTILQAARLAENPLDLRYRALFPRIDTGSVKVASITTVDFRPVGGRRDWNAQGREVPEKIGPQQSWSMVPIEYTKKLDEYALQILGEAGVQELVNRGIIKSVETWPTALADACERQLERDAFEAWFTGVITVMDTKSNKSTAVSLGFNATTTYPTPGTDWDDPGADAYTNLLSGLQAASAKFGTGVGGVRTHRTVLSAIVADAPDGALGAAPTITTLQQRIREEGFPNVTLIIDERTYDEFTDGGSATATRNYVPDGLIGYQPADDRIGNTHVAPVVRAYDFLSGANRSLANGVAIFRDTENDGKTLKIAAQENALAMPEERRVYVEDTGISR